MAKTKACAADAARGGGGHRGGGAGGYGKPGTRGSITGNAKAINARVCRHAGDGDMQGLLDYAASQRVHMNNVNLSTVMHKLAQLAKDGSAAIRMDDWRFAVLHDRVRMALALQSRESQLPGTEVVPRCWSTFAWAYATLNVHGLHLQPVFDVIAELSVPNLAAFNLVEFTNLVWAFAKAQVSNVHFFRAARSHIAANLGSISPGHLSMLVWALVTAKHDQAGILCKLTDNFVSRMSTERVDPVAVSNLMWGLATAKVHPKMSLLQRIGDAASEILPAFKPQELSITAWAFSRLGVCHDRLFSAVAARLCRDPDVQRRMHAQGVANLMWAFNRQRAIDSGAGAQLTSAMQAMLPRCVALFGQLKASELYCISQSLEESGMRWGTSREATAFWDMATASEASPAQAHDVSDTTQQRGHRELSGPPRETVLTGAGDSGPDSHSDAESHDGDGLGMLRSDMCDGDDGDGLGMLRSHMCDGGTVGGAKAPCAADYCKAALHHGRMPVHISVDTMATAADDAKQVLQLPLPAKQVFPMQPFLPEVSHSLGTSPPPVGRLDAPGQGEAAEDALSHPQPRPEQAVCNTDAQAVLLFEEQVCYVVKNTFIEEAGVSSAMGLATAMYASEPLPRADFRAGKLLKFQKLRQRPMHGK